MSTGIKELKLWQEAVALAADVVRIGRSAAKRETKVITDRLLIVATDVAARVAAGYTHDALAIQLEFYISARESLVELETILAIGRQSALLPSDAVLAASARTGSVHRLLSGYVAYLDRQLGDAARASPPAVAVPP